MVGLEISNEPKASERAPQARVLPDRFHANGVAAFHKCEIHFVARTDPEPLSDLLGQDDLPFRAHSVSHTDKYNYLSRAKVLGLRP